MLRFTKYSPVLSLLFAGTLTMSTSDVSAQATPEIPPPPPPSTEAKPAEKKEEAKKAEPEKAAEAPVPAPMPAPGQTGAATMVIPSSPGSSGTESSASTNVSTLTESRKSSKSEAATASSQAGGSGLIKLLNARGGAPKTFRLGFGLDMFGSTGVFTNEDELTRMGATISVAGTPVEHLELWLNTRAQSTTSDLTNPGLLQAQGDFSFGLKGYLDVNPAVNIGAAMQLGLLSGIGDSNFDSAIFGLFGLASLDLSKTEAKAPIHLHANFGAVFDGSSNLTESELSQPERFALGISEYDRLAVSLGIEVPVKYITPFLEYNLEIPLDYLATPGISLSAADNHVASALRVSQSAAEIAGGSEFSRPAVQRAMPQTITPGIRVTAVPNLNLDLAVAIGLTPEQAPGVPTTPPFTVFTQASYTIDPLATSAAPAGPPVTIPVLIPEEKKVEIAPKRGYVMGRVNNLEGGTALKNTIITTDRSPPVATSADGRYLSHEIEPGPVKVTFTKEGFKPQTVELTIAAGQTIESNVKLEPAIKRGRITGKVVGEDRQALSGVEIRVLGKQNTKLTTDSDGLFQTLLEVGDYRVLVSDADMYRIGAKVSVKEGRQSLNFTLRRMPESPLVTIKKQQLKSKKKVKFEEGASDLSDEAKANIDLIVHELMARTGIKKIRVESHVDNANDEADNIRLTRARAEKVANYLISRGIDEERVSWVGSGSKQPRAPNLTARGRKRNRRVEFHIVD